MSSWTRWRAEIALLLVGVACAVGAAALGTPSRYADGVRCGNGFRGVDNPAVLAIPPIDGDADVTPHQLTRSDCTDAVASPRALTYLLLAGGAFALLIDAGLVTRDARGRQRVAA